MGLPKKVLILTNSSAGLWLFRRELIARLIKEGCEVVASTPDDGRVADLEALPCRVVATPVDRRGTSPVRDLGLLRRYMRLLRDEDPGLVITYTVKPNVYGGLVCRLRGVPYAANVAGLGTAFQKPGLLRSLVTRMYRAGLKKARAVFFENADNLSTFVREGIIEEERTCLLSGAGINLDHYALAEYPQDEEPVRFLFVGRVMREKGIDEILAAMRILRAEGITAELDVVGSLEEDYSAELARCEAEGWLCYHGQQDDVRPYVARCHCFMLPSWHEGMANTNLECAAMGRPVVTSDIPGCREAVEDGESGLLCEPRDAGSLADALRKMCELPPERRAAMGRAGRARMEKAFSKDVVVRQTISEISSICFDSGSAELGELSDVMHCA